MRVTDNTNFETVRESIRRSKERMENLQTQSATLRKLNAPSDDPVGAAKVLEIRTDKVNNEQFGVNAKLAETFLNNSDHAIGELVELVNRAKEIAISQSSAASSTPESRQGVAEEVNQLFQQAVAAANRKIGGRYLFGGFQTQKPPIDPNGKYVGDDGQMMIETSKGVFVAMNLSGAEVFNSRPETASDQGGPESQQRTLASEKNDDPSSSRQTGPENVNVFDEIQNLRIGLLTGDLDSIRNTLDGLDQIHGSLVSARAKVGSRMQGLQTSTQALERHNITNAQLSSALEDADMAQVVSDLAKEETVLRSSLSSAHKLISPTLMDFLK